MTKREEAAKAYAKFVDCPNCPLEQKCFFENGEVFSEEKCSEYILKFFQEKEGEKDDKL